ncbi:MAG: RHS repeat-associated core domain-containing protein [Bacteroidales bacterium]|nr:RHS repeat-associated core domain-containing protein [Bacteroidales bacterium]
MGLSHISTISDTSVILGCCSFTGKEKDYESGYHYFGARYYDSEVLAGWLSVDPMSDKYPGISPYAYCAWNPIIWTDPTGDTLDLRGGELAQNDILSIVAEQYRERVSFHNNRVYVNTVDLSSEEVGQDAGLFLLYRLTKSSNRYLYQAEEILNKTGEPIDLWNNSITPFGEFQKKGDPLPDGYQGWVVLHPGLVFNGSDGGEYYSNRPSTVFHELEENYQRTDGKHPYKYLDPKDRRREDPDRLGAHGIAIQKAERLTPSARSVFGTEGSAYSKKIIK